MMEVVERGFLLGGAVEAGRLPGQIERIPVLGPSGFVRAAGRFLHYCLTRRDEGV